MPPDRQLQIVLDENLPWSVAAELKARGYEATSNYALNASGLEDPEWLEIVANLADPAAVLVTYDNAMPVEHEQWLTDLGVTLAVIAAENRPADLTLSSTGGKLSTATRTGSSIKRRPRGGSTGAEDDGDSTDLGVHDAQPGGSRAQKSPEMPHHNRASEFR